LVPPDDGKPDIPRPDPVPVAVPLYHISAERFSSDPSLNLPTAPTSERSTFFAAWIKQLYKL
jgi:hypothetical protein